MNFGVLQNKKNTNKEMDKLSIGQSKNGISTVMVKEYILISS